MSKTWVDFDRLCQRYIRSSENAEWREWVGGPVHLKGGGSATYTSSRPRPTPLTSTRLVLAEDARDDGQCGWAYPLRKGPRVWCCGSYYGNLSVRGNPPTAKLLANMSSANLGEAIGEFGQSVNMVVNRITDVANFLYSIRRGNPLGASQSLKRRLRKQPPSRRIANGYLELKYGWLPLLSDVHSAIQALNEGMASGKGRSVTARTREVVYGDGLKVVVRAGLKGRVTNPYLYNLNRYGLLNPFSIAWNLLPWTFVLDWFLPIGTILGALYGTAGLRVTDAWGVSASRSHTTYTDVVKGGLFASQRNHGAQRNAVLLSPFSVNWQLAPQSTGRILSAVALARQRLR